MRTPIVLFVVLAAASQPSFAQPTIGDPAKGKQLANLWCSSCHLVSPDQPTTTGEAPPFETIAERSADQFAWLRAFLTDPHPPMPRLSLSRAEIRDLVAYIASLKK